MNKEFIKTKLNLIEKELSYLEEYKKFSFEQIVEDYKKQAIIERLLERIITRAVDINQHIISESLDKKQEMPNNYKDTFLRLVKFNIYPKKFAEQISKSVGTRNILAHDYDDIDYSLIYESVKDCLKDYHKYCDYLLKYIKLEDN